MHPFGRLAILASPHRSARRVRVFWSTALLGMAVLTGSLLAASPVLAAAETAKSGVAVCTARVNSAGTLQDFGGKGTTSASAVRNSDGQYDVTCNGSYRSDDDGYQLIPIANPRVSSDAVLRAAGTDVIAHSLTQIVIRVRTFNFDPSVEDNEFYLAVFMAK